VKRVVHGHLADAVALGEGDAGLDGLLGDGLAEFAMRVPDFGGGKTSGQLLNRSARHAAADFGAEVIVEAQRLDAVVRAHAMPRGALRDAHGGLRFVLVVAAGEVSGCDDRIVPLDRHDVHDFIVSIHRCHLGFIGSFARTIAPHYWRLHPTAVAGISWLKGTSYHDHGFGSSDEGRWPSPRLRMITRSRSWTR
jgi:hypothetical protein